MIYAATTGAIGENDGHAWRLIPVPTSTIEKLAVAPDGRIFFSGVEELGLLAVTSSPRCKLSFSTAEPTNLVAPIKAILSASSLRRDTTAVRSGS